MLQQKQQILAILDCFDVDSEAMWQAAQARAMRSKGADEARRVFGDLALLLAEALNERGEEWALPIDRLNDASCGLSSPAILAFLASPNFGHGLARLAALKPYELPCVFSVDQSEKQIVIGYEMMGDDVTDEQHGLISAIELIMLMGLFERALLSRPSPERIVLPALSQSHHAQLSKAYGCPVEEGTQLQIAFPKAIAKEELQPAARAQMSPFLPDGLPYDDEFAQRVAKSIMTHLPSGYVNIETIARDLGLSTRALQRRLREAIGQSYRDMLYTIRMQMADYYIDAKALSSGEIAELLFYRDISSFYRAYQRAHGYSPKERAKMRDEQRILS